MNNALLFISITALAIAIILALPLLFNKVIDHALKTAYKSKEKAQEAREHLIEARNFTSFQIDIIKLFEAAEISDATERRLEAERLLIKCDKALSKCNDVEDKMNKAISILELYRNK